MNKYVVLVGDEYVSIYSPWVISMTKDIHDAVLYGYSTALEVAHDLGGIVVAYK